MPGVVAPNLYTKTAANDKLTGSVAPAISWDGNIYHKGFNMDGACGPKIPAIKKPVLHRQSL